MQVSYPQRIVCLTEETTEFLYLLGEDHRIVGISGYTVRPIQARKEKPKVSAFTSAKIDKIMALEPDLVLGFSDLQADIASDLVRRGVNVHVFNQRSVQDILNMMLLLGSMVGAQEKSAKYVSELNQRLSVMKNKASSLTPRPKIYFEEWNDPLISGIKWVSELIEIAGGLDCFTDLAQHPLGKNRIIADSLEVVRRRPDIIIGSWCGKKFRPEQVRQRPDWDTIPAVSNDDLYEIKSAEILQPGPAALTDGVSRLHDIIVTWHTDRA